MNVSVESWATTSGDVVTVYSALDGYRWNVRARNGEIVGEGESHPRFRDAVTAAERHHPRVEVESFCDDCFAGMESSEHHEKCVAPLDGE